MADSSRPFLVIYVVWHPKFIGGATIAESLLHHFRNPRFKNVTGGIGISVLNRNVAANGSEIPLPIDPRDSETSAIVALVDLKFAKDPAWISYYKDLSAMTETAGLESRLFPVTISNGVLEELIPEEQAIRWHSWTGSVQRRTPRLVGKLTYELCRMLRHYLEHLKRPGTPEDGLEQYLRKVSVFLSHSKKDDRGEKIAKAFDERLRKHSLATFFDVYDIPSGVKFEATLFTNIRRGVVIVIHTDTFSSREWCRKEVIEVKRHNVPLVIASSIGTTDARAFPYMGNVPVVRLDPKKDDHFEVVIFTLLDETLKDFVWRCRVELVRDPTESNVTYIPRPPELLTLATLPQASEAVTPIIVYPDPPLGKEEERLFFDIAPHVQLRSMTEWLARAIR